MDKTTHQVRLAQWTRIIEECNQRPSGMTAKQWLADNNISDKSYYYWQRRIRNKIANSTSVTSSDNEITFADITNPSFSNSSEYHYADGFTADAIIKYGNSVIALSNSVSDAMLSKILEVVAYAR